MKAAALQIVRSAERKSELIPHHDGWHPLDNLPPPEFIPDHWTGPHTGLRLMEGFKTLWRLPMGPFGPSMISGFWPRYRLEWQDLLAQADSDLEIQRWRAEQSNKIRTLPSANEITRMEQAIYWPTQFLKARPIILRVVQTVALCRARDLDLDHIARRMRKTSWRVRYLNRQGLDEIASGLRREGVPVF